MIREIEEFEARFGDASALNLNTLSLCSESIARQDKRYKIRIITFIADRSPVELFNNLKDSEYSISLTKFDDFYMASLKRTIDRKDDNGEKRVVSGSFCLFQVNTTGIWVGFTSESPDFFEKGLVRFIESCKPIISRIYLSSEEMRCLFEKLEDDLSCEVSVKKAVLYSHIEEGQITFERLHFQDLFNKAENEDRYVDKIEFYLVQKGQIIYHGFLSRGGIVYYHSGNINYLIDFVIPLIARKGEFKSDIFSGKARHFGIIEINPIDISYTKNVFNSPSDNVRLIRALTNVSRGAVAVYHKNPYLHLSFLDFVDGSNFDIFVTESNKVSIIPNFKCSTHSLMRICEQISKDFSEGVLEEPKEEEISLANFMSE